MKKIRWEKPWITWGKSVPFVGITIAQEKSVFFIHAIHSTSSSSTIFLLYKKDMDMIGWGKREELREVEKSWEKLGKVGNG